MNRQHWIYTAACLALVFGRAASATTVPFAEEFVADNAGWKDAASLDLSYVASGGPDSSSYASTDYAFNAGGGAGGSSAVLFRGQDEYGFSGGNFIGDWATDTVRKLTAQVRHNAPQPLNYFARISSPFNYPGATVVDFGVVLPNQWTEIVFDLSPTSPQFVSFEGSDWATVLGNIGHVQFGVEIPASLADSDVEYTFDLDQVAIATPEPAAFMLGILGSMVFVSWRRSRPDSTR